MPNWISISKLVPYGKRQTIVTAMSLMLSLGACGGVINTEGNLVSNDALEAIKAGVHTRSQINELLGSPSTTGVFDNDTWYYISRKVYPTTAFVNSELVDQRIVIIKFDPSGLASSIETVGADIAQNIDPEVGETPTAGHSMNVIEQLFGNIGRFDSSSGRATWGGPSGHRGL